MERMNSFSWALNPLLCVTTMFAGCPLSFTRNRFRSSKSFVGFIFLCLSFFILVSHLIINGPRGIDITKFEWMDKLLYKSLYITSHVFFFKRYPDAMLQLVVDCTSIMFFAAVSLIHLVFIVVIFLRQSWTGLVRSLKAIENEMNLSKPFYQKCRRNCIIALLFLFLVRFDHCKVCINWIE